MNRFNALRALTGGLTLVAGACLAPLAVAGPFTVAPGSNGLGGSGTFVADSVGGNSTTRITSLGGGNYQSKGYITYSGFSYLGSPISAFTSNLTGTYGLYATFVQTFACGGQLNVGTTCSVSTISLSLYADPGNQATPGTHDTFVQASLAADPTVTDVNNNDILLGTANAVLSGTAGINALGGAFENVNTNFALTAAGSAYFINPVPFYNLAFSEFLNTSTGIACNPANCVNPTVVAVTFETGSSNFTNAVPEPGSLALASIGFFSVAAFYRRRKQA